MVVAFVGCVCVWGGGVNVNEGGCGFIVMIVGASTVKYTTPLPCIGLSDSDAKLYANFEFCEGKIINILKTH